MSIQERSDFHWERGGDPQSLQLRWASEDARMFPDHIGGQFFGQEGHKKDVRGAM
jgi:hypothetical protein